MQHAAYQALCSPGETLVDLAAHRAARGLPPAIERQSFRVGDLVRVRHTGIVGVVAYMLVTGRLAILVPFGFSSHHPHELELLDRRRA